MEYIPINLRHADDSETEKDFIRRGSIVPEMSSA
jgi:hypothetical protein